MGIEVEDVTYAYRSLKVLKGVSFKASEGKLICVLGKNGAGKTTLFRTLLGSLKGYGGEIKINGKELFAFTEKEFAKEVAYIPQICNPIYNYTVLNMVLMGTTASLGYFQSPGDAQVKTALEALAEVGIEALADRKIGQLSGGERQMVLIARAIAQQAKILVMDEPCSSLDYGNSVKIMKLCKRLSGSGYLIIQSTHNPEHVFLYADEVIVLQDGKISAMGNPSEVLVEDLMSDLYGIDISLHTIKDTSLKICVPL